MLKRRQNPPATLTTNATTNKHNELLFPRGLPSQSEDSKKAGDVNSFEQIGFEYYDFMKKQHEEGKDEGPPDPDEDYFENDLIVEEEDNFDFQE